MTEAQAAGSATADEDWTATWDGMLAAVGTDLSNGRVVRGADPIERSTVRRYLEPLEFDCALHYDPEVAARHGFADITAPYTSVLTFTIPAMWKPGQVLFASEERDAQPTTSPINGDDLRVASHLTGFFATDIEMDFVRPPVAGEHLSKRGNVLLSCTPKWISVGRGAFMTLESEVVTDSGDVIGRVRNTVFAYEPVGPPPAPASSGPASPGSASPGSAPGSTSSTAAERSNGVDEPRPQRYFEDVKVGEPLEPVDFPLSVYRLVMEAGACRDFNSIHHNSEYAKATGAPEMYAATSFLLGTWERAVRDHIGLEGTIRAIRGFRMKKFNPVGTTTVVRGEVISAAKQDGVGVLEVSVWCENGGEVTVGPGVVTVTVPVAP
jgi:acyl dehydratase